MPRARPVRSLSGPILFGCSRPRSGVADVFVLIRQNTMDQRSERRNTSTSRSTFSRKRRRPAFSIGLDAIAAKFGVEFLRERAHGAGQGYPGRKHRARSPRQERQGVGLAGGRVFGGKKGGRGLPNFGFIVSLCLFRPVKGAFLIVTIRRPGCGGRGSAGARRDVRAGNPREALRSAARHGAVTAASLASRVSTRQPSKVR